MSKKIMIGCDHGGVDMKKELTQRLEDLGHTVINIGVDSYDAVDYPNVAVKGAEVVTSGNADCGILICGTGLGIGMAANKVKGIRAATCSDCFSARMAKEHNNANILALGARTLGIELAWEIVTSYLNAEFLGGKHGTRVELLDSIMK